MKNKKNIPLFVSFVAVILSIITIIRYSFAIDENTNQIYTRDELSNMVNELTNRINELENNNSASQVFLKSYPVGSIYISVSSINPGDTYGGTWSSFGSGKTMVVVDTSNTNFNSVEKIGGSLTNAHYHHSPWGITTDYAKILNVGNKYLSEDGNTYIHFSFPLTQNVHGVDLKYNYLTTSNFEIMTPPTTMVNLSTLQPYITVYMWKRTL